MKVIQPVSGNHPSGTAGDTAWFGEQDYHLIESDSGPLLFVINGSRIYRISHALALLLRRATDEGHSRLPHEALVQLGLGTELYVQPDPPAALPLRSLSLAVAQKCNLGCTYCYAEGGDFGGPAKSMSREVALASVTRLFADAAPGERVNLAFLGGEPLLNRKVLFEATEEAARQAAVRNLKLGLSITTNGTLITPADGEFFEKHGFAVTVSLDGLGEDHDRLRSYKSGKSSYEDIVARVTPLLENQSSMQVSARVTVTPKNLKLKKTLDGLIGLGFHSVGFSPMLSSPTGCDQMSREDLQTLLAQMIECAEEFERRVMSYQPYPFSNMQSALAEIHNGTHRPYPCGAGASYFGVSSDGGLFACHRFVGDEDGAMGSVTGGLDQAAQTKWLAERHVHRQQPCRTCWARYLCGGGCHHEVINRGRIACDYIRGWLEHCVKCYVRMSDRAPEYFSPDR